jgi:hypothetical protein
MPEKTRKHSFCHPETRLVTKFWFVSFPCLLFAIVKQVRERAGDRKLLPCNPKKIQVSNRAVA